MPLLINFFRFAGGALMRFLPFMAVAAQTVFKGALNNKKLLKYLPLVVGGLVVLYVVYRREEKELVATVIEAGDPAKDALMISKLLGTHKDLSWFSWDRFGEDEEAVLELLAETKSNITKIEIMYNKISRSGDFMADMQRYLSAKQFDQFLKIIDG
ncbi:MAG: hypothetical protein ABJO02_03350 [Reichenbachiella sp.]|uniref:hypothetical protein n=1 Tax=Reichenbachiella sp. TaxID=2184521 RepID=UPI003299CA08